MLSNDTVGDLIEPELMGHVAILFTWKQFPFHRGCSFNLKPILEAGLIVAGQERRAGEQTVVFAPLDPRGDEIEEKFQGDLSKPRKSTLQDPVETRSGRRLLDSFGSGTSKRFNLFVKKSHAVTA